MVVPTDGGDVMGPVRRRLDEVLVRNGVAPDLEAAQSLIAEGRVLVAGAPALNAARAVGPNEPVGVVDPPRFVGRGGEKLEAALDRFDLDVTGWLALDVGASTGGFTDCMLQRGARRVISVDVGRDQLHERLAVDPRVVSMERTNILAVLVEAVEAALGGLPRIATIDVSFTSLERLVGHVLSLSAPDATLVALVKPQFEASHADASKGAGVVRDRIVWRSAVARCASAIQRSRAGIIGVMASPLKGAAGNVEFLLVAERGRAPTPVDVVDDWIDLAVAHAGSTT
jgi:23S rRNA (cytidine1920-2'-O)/16S rRNA (cytidine1409-2'-O)-methyltransferase